MAKNLEIQGTAQLRNALRAAGERARQAMATALFQEAEAVMAESKQEVPVFEGTLRNSGFVEAPTHEGGVTEVVLGYGGAASGHAIYVHEGTGPAVGRPPFRPPASAFKDWARLVLGDESAAYAVARAVGQRGLAPRKFLEGPLMRRAGDMAARLARRVRHTMGG